MTATHIDLFRRLQSIGIKTETIDHSAMFTVADSQRLRGDLPGGHCKCLFLTDKKSGLWLVVTHEDSRVDLKALRRCIGTSTLSFAKPTILMNVLGVSPGTVTPFGLINDNHVRANVVFDSRLLNYKFLNFHPLTNKKTTTIATPDLMRFIASCGHKPQTVDFIVNLG